MSTEAEIEARRTVIALVRSVIDDDPAAGAYLASNPGDAKELLRALEGMATAVGTLTGSPEPMPSFHIEQGVGPDEEVAKTFDALVAYTAERVRLLATAEGIPPGQLLEKLATAAALDE